jgi:hypothetical protein
LPACDLAAIQWQAACSHLRHACGRTWRATHVPESRAACCDAPRSPLHTPVVPAAKPEPRSAAAAALTLALPTPCAWAWRPGWQQRCPSWSRRAPSVQRCSQMEGPSWGQQRILRQQPSGLPGCRREAPPALGCLLVAQAGGQQQRILEAWLPKTRARAGASCVSAADQAGSRACAFFGRGIARGPSHSCATGCAPMPWRPCTCGVSSHVASLCERYGAPEHQAMPRT